MKRDNVQSSALKAVGYDPDEQLLQIELITNRIYEYKDVPFSAYTNLMQSNSLGRYYNKHIKDEYEFKEIIE